MVKNFAIKAISKSDFEDMIACLMWISQDTLDKNRLLTRDELLESLRSILDRLRIDYTTKAGE